MAAFCLLSVGHAGALASPVRKSISNGVKTGIDLLLESQISVVKGKRLGLITNATGRDSRGRSTIELLRKCRDVALVCVFAPEHGLKGDKPAGKEVDDEREKELPVYSLYGKSQRPTGEILRELDAVVFDIQDIGVRWYTYIGTMARAMKEADEAGVDFIVLDRPNPQGGLKIEGPLLQSVGESLIETFPVPVLHGMTVGELALFYQGEFHLSEKLTVVKMEGWRRSMFWEDTGLRWIPTSPNIPTPEAVLPYGGLGLLGETGLVSVGIGTKYPFQVIKPRVGSPRELAQELNSFRIPGVYFRRRRNTIHIEIRDKKKFMPLSAGIYILYAMRKLYPADFEETFKGKREESFDRHIGTPRVRLALKAGEHPRQIIASWETELADFRKKRQKYLLYD